LGGNEGRGGFRSAKIIFSVDRKAFFKALRSVSFFEEKTEKKQTFNEKKAFFKKIYLFCTKNGMKFQPFCTLPKMPFSIAIIL